MSHSGTGWQGGEQGELSMCEDRGYVNFWGALFVNANSYNELSNQFCYEPIPLFFKKSIILSIIVMTVSILWCRSRRHSWRRKQKACASMFIRPLLSINFVLATVLQGTLVSQTDPAPALRNPAVGKKRKKLTKSTYFHHGTWCHKNVLWECSQGAARKAISLPLAFAPAPSTSTCWVGSS